MRHKSVLDLSGLDWRLAEVVVGREGSWWIARVKVGKVAVEGRGLGTAQALAALVSSGLLWDELGEREPKEG